MLEKAVADGDKRSRQLLEDALLAQQYERDTRQALTATREAQVAAERALQQQTQRLMAAERMRLSDLKVRQPFCWRLHQWCVDMLGCVCVRGRLAVCVAGLAHRCVWQFLQ